MDITTLDCVDPENVEQALITTGDHPYISEVLHYNRTDEFPKLSKLTAYQLSQVLVTCGYIGVSDEKMHKLVDEYLWRLGACEYEFLKVFACETDKYTGDIIYRVRDPDTELARALPGDHYGSFIHIRFVPITPQRYTAACSAGNLRLVKYYDSCGQPSPGDAFRCAVLSGNVELIKWLHGRGAVLTFRNDGHNNDLHYAAMHCCVDIMDLLMTYGNYEISPYLISQAISSNLDMVKWICARVPITPKLYQPCQPLDVIKYLRSFPNMEFPPDYLCSTNKLDTFVYLHGEGCIITQKVLKNAIHIRHMDIINYIHMVTGLARDERYLRSALRYKELFTCLMDCGYQADIQVLKITPASVWWHHINYIYCELKLPKICQYGGAYYLTQRTLDRIQSLGFHVNGPQ